MTIVVSLGLVLVSLNCVQRFAGVSGLLFYIALAWPAGALFMRLAIPRLLDYRQGRRIDTLLALLMILFMIAAFVVLFPIANSGRIGPGSDRDDALNIGLQALLDGRYPYYERTYLNAPLTPFPGALLLTAPFHALGNAAYQNIFWVLAFGVLLWKATGQLRLAALVLLFIAVISPELLKEFVIGGDLGTNALYILVLTQLLFWGTARRRWPSVLNVLLAIGLGMALSSRPNFVLLVPIFLVGLMDRAGWFQAASYMGIVMLSALAVTMPFYIYDPEGFSPLHVTYWVADLDRHNPIFSAVFFVLSGLLSIGLAVWLLRTRTSRLPRERGDTTSAARKLEDTRLFMACAAVQAMPLIMAAIASGFFEPMLVFDAPHLRSWSVRFLSIGHTYVYFLVYAWAMSECHDRPLAIE